MSAVDARRTIHDWLDAHREYAVRFLAELVRVSSDNPPGDCAGHAARAAELLEALGFEVERHAVPAEDVHANGMRSCVNLLVRRRFGAAPPIPCNPHRHVVPPGTASTTAP